MTIRHASDSSVHKQNVGVHIILFPFPALACICFFLIKYDYTVVIFLMQEMLFYAVLSALYSVTDKYVVY